MLLLDRELLLLDLLLSMNGFSANESLRRFGDREEEDALVVSGVVAILLAYPTLCEKENLFFSHV
jgi:hypothetical protein